MDSSLIDLDIYIIHAHTITVNNTPIRRLLIPPSMFVKTKLQNRLIAEQGIFIIIIFSHFA